MVQIGCTLFVCGVPTGAWLEPLAAELPSAGKAIGEYMREHTTKLRNGNVRRPGMLVVSKKPLSSAEETSIPLTIALSFSVRHNYDN